MDKNLSMCLEAGWTAIAIGVGKGGRFSTSLVLNLTQKLNLTNKYFFIISRFVYIFLREFYGFRKKIII